MRRRILCAVLCLLALPLFAKDELFRPATPEELALKDVPFSPGAPAVVLDWVRKRVDETSTETEYVRIKVLKDEGKKYANIEIPFVPRFLSVRGIKARTIAPDGRIINFEGKIYDKLIVKAYGKRLMAKTFTLPEVGVGSIIEYTWIHEFPREILFSTHWNVQRELPVMKQSMSLTPYLKGYSSFVGYSGLPEGKMPRPNGSAYEMQLENFEPLSDEPFAPPADHYAAHVVFYYRKAGSTVDTTEYWKDWAGAAYQYVFDEYLGKPITLKSPATEITAGAETPEAKLRKLYARVQQLRNLSYEEEKTTQEAKRERLRDNKNAADVLRNGYGYRDELNRLFLGLARAAGFDAQLLLASQRDDVFNKDIPDARQLPDEIVTVTLDEKPRYLDPGTPFLPFGRIARDNAGVAALRLVGKKEPGVWVTMPDIPAADAITERNADLKLDGDALTGTVRITYRGLGAVSRRQLVQHSDDAERRKTFEDEAKEWFPAGSTVKLTKLEAIDKTEEPLVAELEVSLPGLGAAAGSRTLVPMAVFSTTRRNPFASQQRKTAIFFAHPYEIRDTVKLALPDGYKVDALPKPASHKSGRMSYENAWASTGNAVTFTRRVTIDTSLIPMERYASVRELFSKIASADEETAVLRAAAAN